MHTHTVLVNASTWWSLLCREYWSPCHTPNRTLSFWNCCSCFPTLWSTLKSVLQSDAYCRSTVLNCRRCMHHHWEGEKTSVWSPSSSPPPHDDIIAKSGRCVAGQWPHVIGTSRGRLAGSWPWVNSGVYSQDRREGLIYNAWDFVPLILAVLINEVF